MLESFLSMPDSAWICRNMLEYTWIYLNLLNGFCFTFPHFNPLSTRTRGHLLQNLHNTRKNRKKHEADFLKRQTLIFSAVTGSIWFAFCFRLNSLTKDFKFAVTFGGRCGRGPGTVNLDKPKLNFWINGKVSTTIQRKIVKNILIHFFRKAIRTLY